MTAPAGLMEQGIQAARRGRKTEARELLLKVVEEEPENAAAWIWLIGLVDSPEDRLIACENALALDPSNEKVRAYLYRLLRERAEDARPSGNSEDPGDAKKDPSFGARPPERSIDLRALARQHEAAGRLDDAIRALGDLASVTTNSREFDRIYGEITRLEGLQRDQILHIAPTSTILRMTLSWPLLYLFLALVQVRLEPFARAAWLLWAGIPVVAAGSFLLAVAEERAPHPVWRHLFAEDDGLGSGAARLAAAAGGWILVGLPHLLLLMDSLNRLNIFQIPYPPLPGG